MKKRILSGVIATALIATLTVPAMASNIPTGSFRGTSNATLEVNLYIPALNMDYGDAILQVAEILAEIKQLDPNDSTTKQHRDDLISRAGKMIAAIQEIDPTMHFPQYEDFISSKSTQTPQVNQPQTILSQVESITMLDDDLMGSRYANINGKDIFINRITTAESDISADGIVGGGMVVMSLYNANLRDMANAFKTTDKKFDFTYDATAKAVYITTGKAYTPIGGENKQIAKNDKLDYAFCSLYFNNQLVSGSKVLWCQYGIFTRQSAICELLNVSYSSEDLTSVINTTKPFVGEKRLSVSEKPVDANVSVTSFSDVPSTHWAYTSIMAMTEKGLFSGKGQIVNGVGRFAPDDTMSRAEFVTVVIRALYKDDLDAMPKSNGAWYQNAYDLAIQNGILERRDLGNGDLSKSMTRQEMSMVLVRAAEKNGEEPESLISTSQIADYDTVGTAYKNYVVYAYSMGMLAGTDSKGTFAPQGTLSRAQASTVLYRLVEPSSRQEVDFTAPTAPVTPPVTEAPQGQQKWVEGEAHSEPKVGDIVIKDGKEIVLKIGYGGVLAAGQGVDIYTGTVLANGRVVGEGTSWFDGSTLRKCSLSSEMHTGSMWADIAASDEVYPKGLVGDYDGETYGIWFKWDATFGAWDWLGPIFA